MIENIKLPKVAVFTVYRKDKPGAHESNHAYSELVLLDRTHSSYHPLLYKLHLDMLQIENPEKISSSNPPSLQQNAELISCEVSSIDRQKKEIILSDMSTIRYKYLIVLHGDSNLSSFEKDEALAAGIPTLNEALRIKNQTERLGYTQSSKKNKKNSAKPVANEQTKLLKALLQSQSTENPTSPINPRHVLEFQT